MDEVEHTPADGEVTIRLQARVLSVDGSSSPARGCVLPGITRQRVLRALLVTTPHEVGSQRRAHRAGTGPLSNAWPRALGGPTPCL